MISAAKIALHKLFSSRSKRMNTVDDGEGMGFFQHLDELRKTLFRCALAFGVSAALSLIFYKHIFKWLQYPLKRALELGEAHRLQDHAEASAAVPGHDVFSGIGALWQLITTGVLPNSALPVSVMTSENMHSHMQILRLIDVFTVLMDVVLFGGIALSFPFIFLAGANFIAPALTSRERRLIIPVVISAVLLFFMGALLSFFWLMPISIEFAMGLARDFGAPFNWTASDYYSFVLMMTLLVGLVFQFPLIIVALQYIEVTTTRWLLKVWPQALFGILFVAVVFTPLGDPLSVSILTGVLFVLYLAAVLFGGWLVARKRRREIAAGLRDETPRVIDDDEDFKTSYRG